MRDPRYDVLFEPVNIGPVTARNRFYQVPHCCGMGHRYPAATAAMRGVKAEGGWAVVCTEETEIHHTGDIAPYNEGRLWDDADIPAMRLMTGAVHEHGSLAGVELCHNGLHASGLYARTAPLAPVHCRTDGGHPVHARAMDKNDIADLRRWHRNAALRARKAGFDLIYVYAGHDMTILHHFLSRRHNTRTDEYGGSLENRLRLFREIIEDTKDAVGDTCAVVVRLAVDELLGSGGIEAEGEGHDAVAMLAELPDLWDVNISTWENDSMPSRFSEEGYQEKYISFVKGLTTKPVVGVGRYTSPDTMVRVIRKGIMDMIGAARPSIADPFLPAKINEGRVDDIRECIGCNICISGDNLCVPTRCTQNPSMGEEWRKGWHPEAIPAIAHREQVLVAGGGPAGMEAARALGQRGLDVILAEAGDEWGGRVAREARLPGLAAWARVRDWRLGQLHKMANVEMYLHSELSADDILEYAIAHVVLATGSTWRRDGTGLAHKTAPFDAQMPATLTPDDLMAQDGIVQISKNGPVVIFDDDHYYMGGVLAELVAAAGHDTTLVTPAGEVSRWAHNTLDQERIQKKLLEMGVTIHAHRTLAGRSKDRLDIACTFTGRRQTIACTTLVPVTARTPVETLYRELKGLPERLSGAGISSLVTIGDCSNPDTIAAAVYAGHQYARQFGTTPDPDSAPFKRERIIWEG